MEENIEMCQNKMKVSRDPMSHRIIEKRRRDRMNSCLADLSRLIPATYLKKGRGRIEKTEIIELAIKHLKQLQAVLYNRKLEHTLDAENNQKSFVNKEQFYLGYQECLHETTCYLVENEGLLLGDPLCVRLLNHLNQHGKNISNKRNLPNGESVFFSGNNGISNLESSCNSLGSFGDVENDDSQPFGLKKSSPRYSSSQVADAAVYDCAEACVIQQGQPLVLNANNVAKMEKFRWQGMELVETQPLKSSIVETEGDVGNIGGMSTCSLSSTIRSDEVFKYKTNIKERFNADQKVSKSDSDADETDDFTPSEEQIRRKKRSAETLQTVPNKRRLSSSGTEDIGTGRDNVMIDNKPDLTDFGNKMRVPVIPIFALHPKGSYYVPMTVDSSLVLPQLKALNHFPSAMHHIEISVSFSSEFVGVNPLITRTK